MGRVYDDGERFKHPQDQCKSCTCYVSHTQLFQTYLHLITSNIKLESFIWIKNFYDWKVQNFKILVIKKKIFPDFPWFYWEVVHNTILWSVCHPNFLHSPVISSGRQGGVCETALCYTLYIPYPGCMLPVVWQLWIWRENTPKWCNL